MCKEVVYDGGGYWLVFFFFLVFCLFWFFLFGLVDGLFGLVDILLFVCVCIDNDNNNKRLFVVFGKFVGSFNDFERYICWCCCWLRYWFWCVFCFGCIYGGGWVGNLRWMIGL